MLTRKEKELKILEFFNLSVGDRLKLYRANFTEQVEIVEIENGFELERDYNNCIRTYIEILFMYDFEVIEHHQKTYREYKCADVKCSKCPLRHFNCSAAGENSTLMDVVEANKDDEDYEYFKNKLNRIVENERELLV